VIRGPARSRRWRRWAPLCAPLALALLVTAAAGQARPSGPPSIGIGLRVAGTGLVDGPGAGLPVILHGVDRSGTEYACIQGWGFFVSPHPYRIDDPAMIAAITSWGANSVRVPLNEDCWLGLHTKPGLGGAPYRRIIASYVRALNAAGLYVILDLHWAAPGDSVADHQLPMADADHAPAFWRSVARTFRSDHDLVFDLFNEPYGIGWSCWRDGCEVPASGGVPAYRTAGMQQLVDAVRSTGASQPLALGGLAHASELAGWSAHMPYDPLHQLIADDHIYGGLAPCDAGCRGAIVATRASHPVLLDEIGETDCADGYVDGLMRFADSHRIGYLAWAWDPTDEGWSCRSGPSLITSLNGTPTAYGIGVRDHLRTLPLGPLPALPLPHVIPGPRAAHRRGEEVQGLRAAREPDQRLRGRARARHGRRAARERRRPAHAGA
jgi:hypothetical protein